MSNSQPLNITPGMGVYGYFKHINYKPWYAIAEFIDNALQSFQTKNGYYITREKCLIDIIYDPNNLFLTIEDNAYGIAENDHERAFTAGVPPSDRSGLSEFGIGMKSAGLWFSPHWSVITQPIDSQKLFTYNLVEKDLKNSSDGCLLPLISNKNSKSGFTRIELRDLHSKLQGKTLKKIKDHLSSIYRCFIRENLLEIKFNGESLEYKDPKILNQPPAWDKNSKKIEWKKSVSIKLNNGALITGFVAIREEGSTSKAGLSLFRRKRLIEGSDEDKKRPVEIFGKPNSYQYQRLFGEIHIDGFDVSHTKDSFNFLEYEEELYEKLRDLINDEPLKLIKQAKEYRVKTMDENSEVKLAEALNKTAQSIKDKSEEIKSIIIDPSKQNTLLKQLTETIKNNNAVEDIKTSNISNLRSENKLNKEVHKDGFFNYKVGGVTWTISVAMQDFNNTNQFNNNELYSFIYANKESEERDSKIKKINVVINTGHPLIIENCSGSPDAINATQSILLALAISEISISAQGHKFVGLMRQSINEIIMKRYSI